MNLLGSSGAFKVSSFPLVHPSVALALAVPVLSCVPRRASERHLGCKGGAHCHHAGRASVRCGAA
eukprot:2858852-Alexandrium_andersonii.AAC.1